MLGNKTRPIIVAYDISENKTRAKVLKILREWRLDGQKSVHECRLAFRQAEELFLQLSQVIDTATDNLIMAWIEPRRKMFASGIGKTAAFRGKIWRV